jgi:CRISPR-associated endonuclease/helicase Cas3
MLKASEPRYEFKYLLAKGSQRPDRPHARETLPRHLLDVAETAKAIVESVGDRCLQSLGLTHTFYRDALEPAIERGAFLHDLGKANHQFQHMIRQGP